METGDEFNKQTAQEVTWIKQHALWLYDKIKDNHQDGMGPIKYRVKAMDMGSLFRINRDDTEYEEDTEEEDTEEPGQPKDKAKLTSTYGYVSQKSTTRSESRLRACTLPKATSVSDIDDIADSEVNMGKAIGRRTGSSPSDEA